MSKNTITIALPFTQEPALHADGWCSVSALGIETVKGRVARRISPADIEAAVRASWQEPATDYARRFAEIEADEASDDASAEPPSTLIQGQRHWLIERLRDVSATLTSLGVPDDGTSPAERVKALVARPCWHERVDAAIQAAEDAGAGTFEDLLRAQGDVVGGPCDECGNVDGQQHGIKCSHARENRATVRSEMRGGLDERARLPLTMILAVARNGVIGNGGKIPWDLPEDRRHFKRMTWGHTCIVGRRTAETLPVLVDRHVVVVSRAPFHAYDTASTIAGAIAAARETDREPIVIGGAEVYAAALPLVTRVLLTEIDADYDGDVRFELDRTGFVETSRRAGETPGVSFVTLERC